MAILKFKDENNQWQDLAALRGRDGVIQYQAGNGIVIDGNVISAIQQDLSNYYTKSQVNDLIDAIDKVSLEAVNELPATGEPGIIYLVPSANPQTANAKDEYIYINNAWEQIGTTAVDLSNYYTKSEVDNLPFEHRWYTVETTLARNEIRNYYQLRNEANDISAAVTNAYADREDILRIKFSYGKNGQSYDKGNEFIEFQHDDADLQTKPTNFVARYIGINGYAKQLVILGSWSGNVFTSTDSYMNMFPNDMETIFRDGTTKQYVDNITGTLSNLTTTDKTNLVAAINEVAAGSGGGIDPAELLKRGIYVRCDAQLNTSSTTSLNAAAISELQTGLQAAYDAGLSTVDITLAFKTNNSNTLGYMTYQVYNLRLHSGTHIIGKPTSMHYLDLNSDTTTYADAAPIRKFELVISATWSGDTITVTNAQYRIVQKNLLFSDNVYAYTPTGSYNPATKKYVDDSIPSVATTSTDGLMSAADKTSLNDLVTAVGSVSSTDVTNWNTAATNSHTHGNKSLLDTITSGDVSDWNDAVNNSHTHSNKTVLDGITSANITAWNKTHIYSGTGTPGSGTGEDGDIYVKYTA